ncbi:hypothetical protein GCM10010304_81170 [Streptomyces roseoviolaceus]
MSVAPGCRPGAGASARQIADIARAAERRAQHHRAKAMLPVTVALSAVIGSGVAAYTNWQVGLITALGVVMCEVWRTYRRTDSSWAKGAAGEQATARLLARLRRRGFAVLHDRAIPGSRANLDHLVIGPTGVTYIDTKAWRSKRSTVSFEGGTLRYGSYAQTRALDTVAWEAQEAAEALGCEVRPVIAVHGARIPGPQGRLETRGVTVVEARRLPALVRSFGAQAGWNAARITAVKQRVEQELPPYTS